MKISKNFPQLRLPETDSNSSIDSSRCNGRAEGENPSARFPHFAAFRRAAASVHSAIDKISMKRFNPFPSRADLSSAETINAAFFGGEARKNRRRSGDL